MRGHVVKYERSQSIPSDQYSREESRTVREPLPNMVHRSHVNKVLAGEGEDIEKGEDGKTLREGGYQQSDKRETFSQQDHDARIPVLSQVRAERYDKGS